MPASVPDADERRTDGMETERCDTYVAPKTKTLLLFVLKHERRLPKEGRA